MNDHKIIAICCSSRHYDTAYQVATAFEQAGHQVYVPNFAFNEETRIVTVVEKEKLTIRFLQLITQCDYLYVYAPDGYIGRSVSMEIGYAHGLGKPIYLSHISITDVEPAIIPVAKMAIAPEFFGQWVRSYGE